MSLVNRCIRIHVFSLKTAVTSLIVVALNCEQLRILLGCLQGCALMRSKTFSEKHAPLTPLKQCNPVSVCSKQTVFQLTLEGIWGASCMYEQCTYSADLQAQTDDVLDFRWKLDPLQETQADREYTAVQRCSG